MEEFDENFSTMMRQYEKEQEQQDEAYEAVLLKVTPIIDEMNILLGQILDIADEGEYNFETEISELVLSELGL
jgi:hypothetical protein